MNLYFAQFTDSHVTVPKRRLFRPHQKIIHPINYLPQKPKFDILTGDLVHEGLQEE